MEKPSLSTAADLSGKLAAQDCGGGKGGVERGLFASHHAPSQLPPPRAAEVTGRDTSLHSLLLPLSTQEVNLLLGLAGVGGRGERSLHWPLHSPPTTPHAVEKATAAVGGGSQWGRRNISWEGRGGGGSITTPSLPLPTPYPVHFWIWAWVRHM